MPQKIVIVEDDQAICQMYRIKFEVVGYRVKTAPNGLVGLTVIEAMRPDIILLDLMMPEMNGDEMLKQLRKTDWGKSIKVVILTNVGESNIAQSINNLNVSGLIIKAQTTPSEVVRSIHQILAIRK